MLKIVKSPKRKSKGLSHDELIAKINTKGTVAEREKVVVDNLSAKGLI